MRNNRYKQKSNLIVKDLQINKKIMKVHKMINIKKNTTKNQETMMIKHRFNNRISQIYLIVFCIKTKKAPLKSLKLKKVTLKTHKLKKIPLKTHKLQRLNSLKLKEVLLKTHKMQKLTLKSHKLQKKVRLKSHKSQKVTLKNHKLLIKK